MRSHAPLLLVPLPEQMAHQLRTYRSEHLNELTPSQEQMLKRYTETPEVLQSLVDSFFSEWWEQGRAFNLETWTRKLLPDLLKIY